MRTNAEIQAEADKVDELLMRPTMTMFEQTSLEAMQNALQWVLGVYADTPAQRLDA
jgi:hypothetical protein